MTKPTTIDTIFEDYRVLIMNGLQQGLTFPEIAVASENQAKQALYTLLDKELIGDYEMVGQIGNGFEGGAVNSIGVAHHNSLKTTQRKKLREMFGKDT